MSETTREALPRMLTFEAKRTSAYDMQYFSSTIIFKNKGKEERIAVKTKPKEEIRLKLKILKFSKRPFQVLLSSFEQT